MSMIRREVTHIIRNPFGLGTYVLWGVTLMIVPMMTQMFRGTIGGLDLVWPWLVVMAQVQTSAVFRDDAQTGILEWILTQPHRLTPYVMAKAAGITLRLGLLALILYSLGLVGLNISGQALDLVYIGLSVIGLTGMTTWVGAICVSARAPLFLAAVILWPFTMGVTLVNTTVPLADWPSGVMIAAGINLIALCGGLLITPWILKETYA